MKTNTVVLILGFLLALFAAGQSQAIPVKILLSQEDGVDPETNNLRFLPMNPDSEVNLTFIKGGLQLEYKSDSGVLKSRKIFTDFKMNEISNEAPEFRKRYERIRFEMVTAKGVATLRQALMDISQLSQVRGLPMVLYFETRGRAGFTATDFDLGEVKIYSPLIGAGVPLEKMLYNMIHQTVVQSVKQSLDQETPAKQPMGFGLPKLMEPDNYRYFCKNIFH